ncbi:hypothetical protein V6N13_135483 [Hibiscus sabdariffa]
MLDEELGDNVISKGGVEAREALQHQARLSEVEVVNKETVPVPIRISPGSPRHPTTYGGVDRASRKVVEPQQVSRPPRGCFRP